MSKRLLLPAGMAAALLFLAVSLTPQTSTLMSAEPPPQQAAAEKVVAEKLVVEKAATIPSDSSGIPTNPAELKILKALAEPIEISLIEEPLGSLVDFLSDQHKIEIVLDTRALDGYDIAADEPITFQVSGVSLRSALDLILRNLDLTWTVDSEVLLITTPDEAENRLTTKTYDVGDLVVCQYEDGRRWDDYDSLIDTITNIVASYTWEETTGGPGIIEGRTFASAKVLVIRQTLQTQLEVAQLLETIREVAKAQGTDFEPPIRERPLQGCPACGKSGGCTSGCLDGASNSGMGMM
jgi:hypothetical protein